MVLEKDHTLILGWNSQIQQIIHEIGLANISNKKNTIVVLADLDRVEMEEDLKPDTPKHTKLIVRSGSPMSIDDLALVQVDQAKSIIILAPDQAEDADSFSIKTALAIINNKNRKSDKYKVIAEIRKQENLEVAELIGKDEISWIQAEDIIGRLIVQTSRERGLSAVYSDLLNFEGEELYLVPAGELVGKSFDDAAVSMEASCMLGLVRQGKANLNPPGKTIIQSSDLLIVLSEDDSTIAFTEPATIEDKKFSKKKLAAGKPEKTLILGSNKALNLILKELAATATKGSSVTIVDSKDVRIQIPKSTLKVTTIQSDSSSRANLTKLGADSYKHVIVLADRESSAEQSDARTMLALLNLREIAKASGKNLNIVSEMLIDQNRELIESESGGDFIVSSKLIGNLIAQVAENISIRPVLQEIFSSEGAQVKVRPADYFVTLGSQVDFNTVTASAIRRGETPIGYMLNKDSKVVLNPNRTALLEYVEGDLIVVLAH
jgi:Trk K+ transport system NAD-binding subunit